MDREKVAQAIAGVEYGDGFDEPFAPFLPHADAAIAAVLEQLREPTEAMVEAGRMCIYDHSGNTDAREVWGEMLSAFLQPQSDATPTAWNESNL